jgi:hypothetical protein|nr:MAG TPA: hypothetical protein [Caudoviricetes sp.]
MTYVILYSYSDDLGNTFFKELEINVRSIKHLHRKIRNLEQQLEFLDFHVVDIKLL